MHTNTTLKNVRSFIYLPITRLRRSILPQYGKKYTNGKVCCGEKNFFFLFLARQPPSGPWPSHSRGFIDHTQRRITVDRTPLDE